jgi:hypothetical protein
MEEKVLAVAKLPTSTIVWQIIAPVTKKTAHQGMFLDFSFGMTASLALLGVAASMM